MPAARDRHIVFGAFQPDLEDSLVAEIESRLARHGPLAPSLLLVGSNLLGIHLTRLLSRRLGAVGGIRVMTILDLASSVTKDDVAREGLRPIPGAAQRLLVRTLAASLGPASYFARIAATDGFEGALLATLHEMREAGLSADDLRRAFPKSNRKARDLADLLEGYERKLAAGRLIDRPGLVRRAAAILDEPSGARGQGPAEDLVAAPSCLLVYGFYDFTRMQESLVLSLAALLPTVVFFPGQDSPAFDFARDTRERLLRAGFKEKPASRGAGSARHPAAREDAPALDRMRARLFIPLSQHGAGEPTDTTGPDSSLRILAAPGEARETAEAARAIVEWARRAVPLEEIGVLFRSGDEYPRLLASVLDELGVKFFGTQGESLRTTRAARSLFLLFDIKERDHERSDVIEFLTTSDLEAGVLTDGPGAGQDRTCEPPNPADWDLLSRLAGVVSGREAWSEKLLRLGRAFEFRAGGIDSAVEEQESEPPPDPRLLDECRRLRLLHGRLSRAIATIPDEGTWSDFSRACAAILLKFLAASEERESVVEALEDLVALEAIEKRTTLREFRRLLSFDLEQRQPRVGHFQRGHLYLGDVPGARGLGFRAVIVLGLTEQSFPPPIRQDPILLDGERRILNRAGGAGIRLPIKEERAREERLMFALAAASASESLILTYPRLDPENGRERLPSSLLLRTIEAITAQSCDYERLQAFVERIGLSELFPEDRRRAILGREFDLSRVVEGLRTGHSGLVLSPAMAPGQPPFLLRGLAFESQRWGERRFTTVDGVLSSRAARETLTARCGLAGVPVSPTRLQQYMTCPYQYFCERILGLEPLDAPEQIERLSALDRGTLMHRVLHEFFAGLLDAGELPLRRRSRGAHLDGLLAILDRRFSEAEALGLTGLPLLHDIERDRIREDLARVLDLEIDEAEAEGGAGLRPAHFEVRFGMPPSHRTGSDVPPEDPLSREEPVPLSPEDADLQFKGQIDRIDLSADGKRARVIDYKSGRIDQYEDNAHHAGTALQASAYFLATEHLLPDARVEQAQYRSISRRGRFARRGLDHEAWPRMRDDLRAAGRIVRDGIAAGTFIHYPAEQVCKYCDARPVCGEGREARLERKKSDPAARPFLEFKNRSTGP